MPTLLFVYNADSGLFDALADMAHKVFSPSTYACNLCTLTHGTFGMRNEWKAFLAELGRPLEFLHRDEFYRQYGMQALPLPAILLKKTEQSVELWIDAATINATKDLGEMKQLLAERLKSLSPLP